MPVVAIHGPGAEHALFAVTKLPAVLFLFRGREKTHGIVLVSGESMSWCGVGLRTRCSLRSVRFAEIPFFRCSYCSVRDVAGARNLWEVEVSVQLTEVRWSVEEQSRAIAVSR
jgi:hypothetical protein